MSRIQRSLLLLLTMTTMAVSSTALALPAPKTEAEMMQLADLVVDAEGASISCDGVPIVDPQKTTTKYLSTLFPSKSYKGGLPNSFQVRGYTEAWVGPPPTGGWHQEPVPKGWVGKLFLKRETDGTYTKVWWNASIEDTSQSKPLPLPGCATATDGGIADRTKVDAPAKVDALAKVDAPAKTDGVLVKVDAPASVDRAPRVDQAQGGTGGSGCSCTLATRERAPAALGLLGLGLLLAVLCGRSLGARARRPR